MSYRPAQPVAFGPPVVELVPSIVYFAAALAVVAFVAAGHVAPAGSWVHRYVVDEDARRVLGAGPLAVVMVLSALAAVVRARMRGVVVHPDGLEARDSSFGAWPRVRRFAWPQIDAIFVGGERSVALDLWDGRREWLPAVRASSELRAMLEHVAAARAIPLRGGDGEA